MKYVLTLVRLAVCALTAVSVSANACADQALLKAHCAKCHSGKKPKGDFDLRNLSGPTNTQNINLWTESLDYVKAKEMPPAKAAKASGLTNTDRQRLIQYLERAVRAHESANAKPQAVLARRLNNRELHNSVSDVLGIEDVGTHEPTANLLGDTLKDGFDTNGDALGISEYHLEQYINAFRQIVDATVLEGERPETQRITVDSKNLRIYETSNRNRAERANRTDESIEILDLRKRVYFDNFEVVPATGRYVIKLRAQGMDRRYYDSEQTGHYEDDPIRIRVHLGERVRDFDLPEDAPGILEIDEWLAKGTRIRISYLTDALRLKGNGNFKFQNRIAHDYILANDRQLYDKVARRVEKVGKKNVNHWSNWTDYWRGPRPRLFDAEIEGPIYASWPPKRHTALLGDSPSAQNAEAILTPIAQRAWRRAVRDDELDSIVALVQNRAKTIGDIAAIKEGIVAVLVSPSFLIVQQDLAAPADRFASKLSFFLRSRIPSSHLRDTANQGQFDTYDGVLTELKRQIDNGDADAFLDEFPNAWLQLDRINFMSPDPDKFPLYEKKRFSEDMVQEVLAFFRHAVENNVPITELLTADYSFVNADLGKVYDLKNVPRDSKLRKHTFRDGRRGGLLGMGAFLTLTADSLGTSPIHRAVYVMENFLGIHPDPPPADVQIQEPDVRQAKTIKEILAAHVSDENCAACHKRIDPYGYAFENFDPMGSWRKTYEPELDTPKQKQRRDSKTEIPIDASADFLSGESYDGIVEFRQLIQGDVNRDRFVRCFVSKLLTYANGVAPDNYSEIEKIMAKSADNEYRIVETIAAVIDSPLFRGPK